MRKIHPETPPPFERKGIGRYDVIYPLASGGMANVYVGRLSGMAGFEKLVTLKLIHSHLSNQREFVDMFLDEARIAARIHHPNIGEIYEIVEDHGQLFIAAEYVDGRSLRHLLRERRKQNISVSCALAAWICAEVCQGLQVVHDLKDDDGTPLHPVHRDISPDNILVSYNGWVKLIDFGVAFVRDRLAHTNPGNLKGKIGYISPEQIKGEPLDRRADIFSLGVILYLATTGRHPFPGRSEAERLRKTLYCELVPPSSIAAGIDAAFESIIGKAMAVSPEHRYQQASELEADLRQYITASGQKPCAAELSGLMQSVFTSEINAHRTKLREFRKNQQSTTVEPGTGDNVVYLLPSTEPEPRLSTTVLGRSTGEQLEDAGNRRKKWALAGGAVLSGILLAGLVSVFTSGAGTEQAGSADLSNGTGTEQVGSADLSNESEGIEMVSADGVFADEQTVAATALHEKKVDSPATENPGVDEMAFVEIVLTRRPADVELLLDGEPIHVESNVIHLPNDGQKHAVLARASGYLSHTYWVAAQKGESLDIALSPSEAARSGRVTRLRAKSKGSHRMKRKTRTKTRTRPPQKVLTRNPY